MFNVVLDPSCPSGNSQGLGEAFCVISRADGDSVCRVWVRGLCRVGVDCLFTDYTLQKGRRIIS